MRSVTLFEAKTHLSRLINEVALTGHKIAITRHGHPIALLSSAEQTKENSVEEILAGMSALRAELSKQKVTRKEIQKVCEEGHK